MMPILGRPCQLPLVSFEKSKLSDIPLSQACCDVSDFSSSKAPASSLVSVLGRLGRKY